MLPLLDPNRQHNSNSQISCNRLVCLQEVLMTVGVGIVGLSAGGGWAARGHLPALAAVPGFRLVASSASSAESARAAGERYDVPRTFGSAAELAACPEVDLVVVSVQAARHAPAVRAAIDAG